MVSYNGPVNAFHTAGAVKALTTSYVAGDTIDDIKSNVVRFLCSLVSTASPSLVSLKVEWSYDGTAWFPLDAHAAPSSGVIAVSDAVFTRAPAANSEKWLITVPAPVGGAIRISAKDSGTGTASTILIKAVPAVE